MTYQADLHEEVALVTGGNRNIGLAIAQALSTSGARVCIWGGSDADALGKALNSIEGDEAPIREPLEAAGLMPRVRFLGYMDDIANILETTDVYLSTFPVSGGQSVLEPMAAAKPVVTLRHGEATHFNAGAELAGLEEVLADSEDGYMELATRFIADAALRQELGEKLQKRFRENFRPTDLGPKYTDFMREVIEKATT